MAGRSAGARAPGTGASVRRASEADVPRRRALLALACLFWAALFAGILVCGQYELACNVLCCLVYVRGTEEVFERSCRRSLTWRRWRSVPARGAEPAGVCTVVRGATPEFHSYAYRQLFGRAAFLADGLQFIGYAFLLVAPSWTALGFGAAWLVAHAVALGRWERRLRRSSELPPGADPYRVEVLAARPEHRDLDALPCA